MKRRGTFWASVVAVNLILAAAGAFAAPAKVGTTADRLGYEYVGAHPLAPNCPHTIFCYRVLVPVALERVALPAPLRWRVFAAAANATTGVLLAAVAVTAGAGGVGALIASVLFQTSFGATFALFDPFTPDPAVFLAAALIALAWLRSWPLMALVVGLVGVFAKETVAVVLTAAALAAWFHRRHASPVEWFVAAGLTWLVVLGWHLGLDRLAGDSAAGSGSADLAGGAWLGRWLADTTLTPSTRLLYVFIPFAFAWLYAPLAIPHAPMRLRYLALGALIALPGLIYVQTMERALSTAAFVVVPLAAIFLGRLPPALGIAAAVTNGLLTARVGLSTAWLPPVPYLLALAAIVAVVAIARGLAGARLASTATFSASRVASSK
ncbi:MAG TPA: hypothetical protein VKV73_24035 [Chloroflexota bacterium]|nr:hypothetical protein [Chloroflexota bacterium]